VRLKRETLLHNLLRVSPGLAAREILEQSASFIFKDGRIYTFNDEILCIADYDCDFDGAVHAAPLVALLNKMEEDEIDIAPNAEGLMIAGKRSRAVVRMHNEILLPIDSVDEPEGWSELHNDFGDALDVVQGSASKDDLHFNLTCIHLSPKYVEACDGYQMTRYNIDTGMDKDCLIKRDSAKSIIGLGMSHVSEGKNWIHFRSDKLTISCRRWVQDYIDLDELIDFSGRKTTLPGGLSEAVDKAEIFSSNNTSDNQITVRIKDGKLRLKGEGVHGWYEEIKKIEYGGESIQFMIPPRLLVEITKRTNDCEVTAERLKIDAGKFVFVACLGVVEDSPTSNTKTETEQVDTNGDQHDGVKEGRKRRRKSTS